jgi:CBS domain-containing protein
MVKTKVKKIMTTNVITIRSDDSVSDAIKKLIDHDISGIPVLNDTDELVGIICESDILRALKTEFRTVSLVFPSSHAMGMTFEESTEQRKIKDALSELKSVNVEEIMSTDVISIDPNKTIGEVSQIMVKNNINRVPVMKNDKLIGIVTRGDIIKGLAEIR